MGVGYIITNVSLPCDVLETETSGPADASILVLLAEQLQVSLFDSAVDKVIEKKKRNKRRKKKSNL